MTEETRKIQLGVEVDSTGAKSGFNEIKQDARSMAADVAQSGQAASKAIDGIGNGGEAAAKKVDAATRSIANSIQRTIAVAEAGERGTAKYFEALGNQRGADMTFLKPYLDGMREVESRTKSAAAAQKDFLQLTTSRGATGYQKPLGDLTTSLGASGFGSIADAAKKADAEGSKALTNIGMSAKATAAALRGVPAQFTDIFTSLQGGQNVTTVLLQQGGQLKDMFGGIGPAARAMGGYLANLVGPATLAALAIGGLAVALHQGAAEQKEFQNAATISGNSLGSSLSKYGALRDSLAGIAGTKGKASEVLTEIAGNSQIAGDSIKDIGEAAILMEKATGQSIGKTVAQFQKLREAPAAASLEFNKTYNYLTGAVYAQITALEEQGKKYEAAEVAEKAYATALKERATAVLQNVGALQKAWLGLSDGAKKAWDNMLAIGREDTLLDKLNKAQQNVARTQSQIDGIRTFDSTGGGAALGGASAIRKAAAENENATARQQQAYAAEAVRLEKRVSESQTEANRVRERGLQATVTFQKLQEESLTKQQKLEKEITQARRDGVDAGRSQVEIDKVVASIRERHKESGAAGTGQSEVAGIRARIKEQTELYARLRAQAQDPELREPVQATEGAKLVLRIQEELKTSITGVARAQKEKALAAAVELASIDKLNVAQTVQNKGLVSALDAYNKLIDTTGRQADSILQQALGQEAANATLGKSKTAIEELTLAQLKSSLAEAEASDRFAPAYVAALNAKTEAQERFVRSLQVGEYKQADQKLTEAGRIAGESTQSLQLELSLMGQTQETRERILGQRRAEVQLAKELNEIDKLNLGTGTEADEARERLRAKARSNSLVESSNAAAKAAADEWQRTAEVINTGLTDALLRGFEKGKSFAANLRDTVVNMFKTMVLRPVVSAIVSPVTAGFANAVGVGGQGVGPAVSTASNLNSLYGTASQFISGGTAGATGASLAYANGVGALGGDALGALISANGSWAGVSAGAGAAGAAGAGAAAGVGGLSAGLAAIPGWGWAALGAAALLSMGGSSKSTASTGNAASRFDAYGNNIGTQTFYGGSSPAVDAQIASMQANYQSAAKALGITTTASEFTYGGNTGRNGESPNFALGGGAGGSSFYSGELQLDDASLQLAASRAVFAALKGSQLPDYLAGIFDGISASAASQAQIDGVLASAQAFKALHQQLDALPFDNLKNLSYGAASALVSLSGSMEKFTGSLSTYYDNFYTAQEKAANSAKGIYRALASAGVDTSTLYKPSVESFRALVEAQDLSTQSGREAYAALIGVSGAFASLVTGASAVSIATDNLKTSLTTSIGKLQDLSGAVKSAAEANGTGLSRAEGQAQISAALAIARASGTLPDAKSLEPALKALAQPSQDLFSTLLDYQRDQARTASDLASLGGMADAQISVQQSQLDALNTVNTSVLSVAQAVAALAQAEAESGSQAIAAAQAGQADRQSAALAAQIASEANAASAARAAAAAAAAAIAAARVAQVPIDPFGSFGYFADGGDHPGGWRVVGERGPELELTGPSKIISSENILSVLRNPQAANAELANEVRALRQEVASLRASSEATAANTRKTADTLQRVTRDGNAMVTEPA